MQTPAKLTADVCIVGAGIAGLNAAFVASQYLGKNGTVVLVDRRLRVGGMWVDTYDYVRLHQPHPFFTAGNIKWTLNRERSYLPDKQEVLGHLEHCLEVIETRTNLEVRLGWSFQSHEETADGVRATFTSADGELHVVEAKKLIKAYGYAISPNEPLAVSSESVRSVSPNDCDMRGAEMRASTEPVWVIGSGKTGMDTALTLVREYPGRTIRLLAGSGTVFTNRDHLSPTGVRRWTSGTLTTSLVREATLKFDGTNELAVMDWFVGSWGMAPLGPGRNFYLANLSEKEAEAVRNGVSEVVMDHLVDVVDGQHGPELVLRSGARRRVEPGSWLVNCTGYMLTKHQPYEPYISKSGNVLSIQMRSTTLVFSTFAAYFLTHLLFAGKASQVPLYELDSEDLRRKSGPAFALSTLTQLQYNLGLLFDALPPKPFLENGLDFDRWYPLPRRLVGMTTFAVMHRRDRGHYQRTLDTIRQRFDVRCGTLLHT